MDVFDLSATLNLNSGDYESALNQASKTTEEFSRSAEGASQGVSVFDVALGNLVAQGISGAISSIVSFTQELIGMGDAIDKNSQRANMSSSTYQEWAHVLELGGGSAESLTSATRTLSGVLTEASNGGEKANEKLNAIGLSYQDLAGMSPEQQFEKVVYALADMEEGAERTALAQQLLGRAGMDMIPALNQGSATIAAQRQEANDLNLVISEDTVKASAQLNDAMTNLSGAFKGAAGNIVGSMLPALTDIVKGFTDLVRGVEGAEQNIVSGVVSLVDNIGTTIVKGLPIVLNAATKLFGGLVDALPDIQNKLYDALPDVILAIGNFFIENTPKLIASILEMGWNAIKAIPRLIPALIDVLNQLLQTLINTILSWGKKLFSTALDAAKNIVAGIKAGLTGGSSAVATEVATAVEETAPAAEAAADKVVTKTTTRITSATAKKRSTVKKAGKSLLEQFTDGMTSEFQLAKQAIDVQAAGLFEGLDVGKNLSMVPALSTMLSQCTSLVGENGAAMARELIDKFFVRGQNGSLQFNQAILKDKEGLVAAIRELFEKYATTGAPQDAQKMAQSVSTAYQQAMQAQKLQESGLFGDIDWSQNTEMIGPMTQLLDTYTQIYGEKGKEAAEAWISKFVERNEQGKLQFRQGLTQDGLMPVLLQDIDNAKNSLPNKMTEFWTNLQNQWNMNKMQYQLEDIGINSQFDFQNNPELMAQVQQFTSWFTSSYGKAGTQAAAELYNKWLEEAKERGQDIREYIIENQEQVYADVMERHQSLQEDIREQTNNGTNSTIDMVTNLINSGGKNWQSLLLSEGLKMGKNMIAGMQTGIENDWGPFEGWLTSLMQMLIKSISGIFGIFSPSRVFAGIGENLILGLQEGVADTFAPFERSTLADMQAFSDSAADALSGTRRINWPDLAQSNIQMQQGQMMAASHAIESGSISFSDSVLKGMRDFQGQMTAEMLNAISASQDNSRGGQFHATIDLGGAEVGEQVFNLNRAHIRSISTSRDAMASTILRR